MIISCSLLLPCEGQRREEPPARAAAVTVKTAVAVGGAATAREAVVVQAVRRGLVERSQVTLEAVAPHLGAATALVQALTMKDEPYIRREPLSSLSC